MVRHSISLLQNTDGNIIVTGIMALYRKEMRMRESSRSNSRESDSNARSASFLCYSRVANAHRTLLLTNMLRNTGALSSDVHFKLYH